jgi:hypothetical protein
MIRKESRAAIRLFLAVTATVLLVASCRSAGLGMPTILQLETRGLPPEIDVGALDRGRAIAITECAGCHRHYWPEERRPNHWSRILRNMGERASLSSEEVEDLQLYFSTVSVLAQREKTNP